MTATDPDVFARLLTEAIYRIRNLESKSVGIIQDELGYALGKKGGASVEHWRKGNVPSRQSEIESLAREIIGRCDLGAAWLKNFLDSAGYLQTTQLYDELFPDVPEQTFGFNPAGKNFISTPPITHQLPTQLTPFIGREEELARITNRLSDPNCRLLTLVGPGGIGKTRLALQTAGLQPELFPYGIYFVSLAPLSSVDFLLSTIANALNFSFYSDETAKTQLLNYLQAKPLLLILDNFEHLIGAVKLVADILEATRQVKVLVTSRERLNLRGEWVFEVPGMQFPVRHSAALPRLDDDIERFSAVQLFLQSARRARADFVLMEQDKNFVTQICQLVEGIPLAIELAAGWVRLLSCREIAEEIQHNVEFLATSLRDVPERHRSLQAVFEYSWDLLIDKEKQAIKQLSVFRGGFRRQAAAYVAGASLFTLSALADKSFLYRVPSPAGATHDSTNRYEMHELLRLFAAEKLKKSPDPVELLETQRRHGDYFTEFLHQRSDHFKGPRQKETIEEIDEEIENVRAAWQWAIANRKMIEIGQSLEALFYFYDIHGWIQEGEEVFRTATIVLRAGSGRDNPPNPDFALALAHHARFCHRLGQYNEAKEMLQESLASFQALNMPEEEANTLNSLGKIAHRKGEYIEARRCCLESLAICHQINYQWGTVYALEILGSTAEMLGDYNEAKTRLQEGLQICQKLGDKRGIATFLNELALVDWRLGEDVEAEQLCQESLLIYQEIGDRTGIAMGLKTLGNLAVEAQNYDLARQYYENGLKICQEIGYQWGIAVFYNNLGDLAWSAGDYPTAKKLCEEGLVILRRIGHQWVIGGSLETLGNVAEAMGQYTEAKIYFREALQLAMDIQAIPLALDVLIGMAKLMLREGKKQNVLEILAFVLNHPAIDQEGRRKAEKLLTTIASELAAEIIANAQERGKEKEFRQVVCEILQVTQ